MGTGAEVHEHAVDGVAGDDRPALLFDQLDLEPLAALGEVALGLVLRHHLAFVGEVLLRDLAHFRLDRLEVLGHERTVDDEVVEEPVLGRRPDAALGLREQGGDRGGQQMRGAVPIQRQRLRAVPGHDAHRRILLERDGSGRPCGRRRWRPARPWRGGAICPRPRRARGSPPACAAWNRPAGSRSPVPWSSCVAVLMRGGAACEDGRHGRTRTADLLRVKQAL